MLSNLENMSEHTSEAHRHTHRYGTAGPTPTGPPGPSHQPGPMFGAPMPPPGQPGALATRPPRRHGPGIVVAAVLAGALAGTAGAAGYAALTDDTTTTPSVTSLDTAPASNTRHDAMTGVEGVASAVRPSTVQIN